MIPVLWLMLWGVPRGLVVGSRKMLEEVVFVIAVFADSRALSAAAVVMVRC